MGQVIGDSYIKRVRFSKAVLWKSREISIHKEVAEMWLRSPGVKRVIFTDPVKGEKWIAKKEKVMEKWQLRKEGQEPQYYVPIGVFQTKKRLTEDEEAMELSRQCL